MTAYNQEFKNGHNKFQQASQSNLNVLLYNGYRSVCVCVCARACVRVAVSSVRPGHIHCKFEQTSHRRL